MTMLKTSARHRAPGLPSVRAHVRQATPRKSRARALFAATALALTVALFGCSAAAGPVAPPAGREST